VRAALACVEVADVRAPALDLLDKRAIHIRVQPERLGAHGLHALHELVEHRQVQTRILLAGHGNELIEWHPACQLGQVDEVTWLRTTEDRQHLVRAQLAQIQRRAVSGWHRIQRAVVDADVDLAVLVSITNREAHERLRLPLPADLKPSRLRGILECVGELLHRRSVVRPREVVQVARSSMSCAGIAAPPASTKSADSGSAATNAATRSCSALSATTYEAWEALKRSRARSRQSRTVTSRCCASHAIHARLTAGGRINSSHKSSSTSTSMK
jgi:hypothetical protein